MQKEAIEPGGEQGGSTEAEGEQQHDGEIGCAVVARKQGTEDSPHAASVELLACQPGLQRFFR
jgi:hypothetical protein